jgi:threonine dehydratase
MTIPYSWLEKAAERISPYIRKTPLTFDPENDLFLKWENQQVTGSFKARGAFNKVLSLEDWERSTGLLAASAGNHGQGLALAGKQLCAPVTVFASEHAVKAKIEGMRALGAKVRLVPGGYGEAEKAALAEASVSNATWVSPYNDGQVISGQGTTGLEILEQLATYPNFRLEKSVWLVPTSGGGLLAGIGASISKESSRPRLIGVQSETSAFMYAIFHTGSQDGIVEYPTIADGLAGPVEPGSITIPLVRTYVDDLLLVTEEETRQAVAYAWERYGERIEGSAAVALAAAITGKVKQRPAVIVISGGNIQDEFFDEITGAK